MADTADDDAAAMGKRKQVRGGKARPFRRKRRSWLFKIERITNHGITGSDLLASVCHRYSTVKKLVLTSEESPERGPAPSSFGAAAAASPAVLVEIRFAGPQPSESCGALLCLLLGGDSVQAWPVDLPRGRKRKNTVPTEELKANDEAQPAAASADPPRYRASKVPGILPPPPKRREGCEEHQLHAHPQENQLHGHPHPHPHLHPRQHQPFGNQNAVSDNNRAFHAAQPSQEARAPQYRLAGDHTGVGRFGVGVGGPYFSAPEGLAGSDSIDGRGVLFPMDEVMVKPLPTECDLDGRPFPGARMTGEGAPIASDGPADDRQCYLVFTGLEETGHDLNSLRVTALFGVDAVHQTATVTSPLQVGADGRVYASLFYPSLQEIWPELYSMPNIPVVEVDIEVEILSDVGGEHRYRGPQLKVAYHRADPPANVAGAAAAGAAGEAAGGYWGGSTAPPSPAPHPAAAGGDGEFRPLYSHPRPDRS